MKTRVKEKQLKIYLVGHSFNYANWLNELSNLIYTSDIKEADLMMFTGGEDVTPSMYGANKHPTTYNNEARDSKEKDLFELAVKNKVPIIGICRGSQFLTAMNGGKVIQNVNHHAGGEHTIQFDEKCSMFFNKVPDSVAYRANPTLDQSKVGIASITSTHHQMMYPFNLIENKEYQLLAWSHARRSEIYERSSKADSYPIKDVKKEAEIVYYPITNSLAIQGHPEMMQRSMIPSKGDNNYYFLKKLRTLMYEVLDL